MMRWLFESKKYRAPETLGEFVRSCHPYLMRIRQLSAVFAETDTMLSEDPEARIRLGDDVQQLLAWVLKYGWDRVVGPTWFTNTDADGNVTEDSTGRVGFGFSLLDPSANSPRLIMNFHARNQSGFQQPSAVRFTGLPASLVEREFLQQLMRITAEHFDPDVCGVVSVPLCDKAGEMVRRMPQPPVIRLGWINYFGNPAIRESVPDWAMVEDCGPGLMVTTQPDVPDIDKADDVARAREFHEHLREAGWLEYPRMKRPGCGTLDPKSGEFSP